MKLFKIMAKALLYTVIAALFVTLMCVWMIAIKTVVHFCVSAFIIVFLVITGALWVTDDNES